MLLDGQSMSVLPLEVAWEQDQNAAHAHPMEAQSCLAGIEVSYFVLIFMSMSLTSC